ncbi:MULTISPECIES: hypothetical protein [unclassified Corynebacterium]|uniref:hypothetical protein n=1 Tax=unclassified Corynebacterium TaxID=2624378 RepID=UPI0029CA806B|nr:MULTISPECIES: hypothetical protein [unclassified Corynebacterium]WPF66648.1 hypothetical protein OLX12_02635 [Corynebacterium sp. 22KM0430]WPF69136.1 hypothetical protein OLW90_02630 [Corynebacterium sp. 21KM1197]
MLIPVPGYSHLKVHVGGPGDPDHAPQPDNAALPLPQDEQNAPQRLRARVLVLLEVLCRQRPPRQLSPLAYAPAVIAQAGFPRTGPQAVRLRSLHLRDRHHDHPEFYGTCEIGGERYGFTGWVSKGKIAGFKVLR